MTGNEQSSTLLIYSVINETLANQQTQKSSLETKASTLIAFAGGMFALLMGARATLILLPRNSQVLILISIAFFVASVIHLRLQPKIVRGVGLVVAAILTVFFSFLLYAVLNIRSAVF